SLANSALAVALQDAGLVKQKEPEQDMTVREFVLKHKLEHAAAAIEKANKFKQATGNSTGRELIDPEAKFRDVDRFRRMQMNQLPPGARLHHRERKQTI
ncbi:MAG: hypothetical protein V1909_03445, partial [Candidatus Micrarchaeota archaeon]